MTMRSFTAICVLLAACYQPEVQDCTIECTGANQCGSGQICGADGFCAAPDVAGHCTTNDDQQPQSMSLTVTIEGSGKVSIEGVGTCDSETAAEGNCTFPVTSGVMLQLTAVPKKDREFISWTATCTGTDMTCALTPVMALTQVGAKFE